MTDIVQKLWGFCQRFATTALRRLHRADHVSALPQDGRRARRRHPKASSARRPACSATSTPAPSRASRTRSNLKRLISLIDETEWTALDVDVKAAAYEGLLEKAASEGKKGAGQYFTPRVLITEESW
jgi:hypothetical protein